MSLKIRSSNIELLRIFAMLFIVSGHFCTHGIMHWTEPSHFQIWMGGTFLNKVVSAALLSGGQIGVALFFIITGYFLIHKEKGKFLRVIVQTVFYSLLMTCVFFTTKTFGMLYGESSFNIMAQTIKSIFIPISGGDTGL